MVTAVSGNSSHVQEGSMQKLVDFAEKRGAEVGADQIFLDVLGPQGFEKLKVRLEAQAIKPERAQDSVKLIKTLSKMFPEQAPRLLQELNRQMFGLEITIDQARETIAELTTNPNAEQLVRSAAKELTMGGDVAGNISRLAEARRNEARSFATAA